MVVVADGRDIAADLQSKLLRWLPTAVTRASRDTWQDYLAEVVFPGRSKLVNTGITVLSNYVRSTVKERA